MKNIIECINQIKQEIKKNNKSLVIKKSKQNKSFLKILRNEGIIQHYTAAQKTFTIYFRYDNKKTSILKQLKILSTPSKPKLIKSENNPYALNIVVNNNQILKQKKPFKNKIIFSKII